jgi:hypothetical protein
MKLRQIITAISLSLGISLFSSASVLAAHYWQVDISTPGPVINSRSFNIQFTTLSVEADDQIKIEAFQGEDLIGTTTTVKPYGDSGAFAVTVPADGVYSYHLRATLDDGEGTEVKTTETKFVTVDATAPGAPVYQGKIRNGGNTYTVTFKAPADADVQLVRIFSSTKTTFTADNNTQVGIVSVSPGQTVNFTYTASDSSERFHAVQAFDTAGNGSALTGDPHVVVRSGNNGTATLASVLGGEVAGANTEVNGHVEGGASSTTKSNKKAAVLGTQHKADTHSKAGLWTIIGVLVALALLYYLMFYRNGRRNPFRSTN